MRHRNVVSQSFFLPPLLCLCLHFGCAAPERPPSAMMQSMAALTDRVTRMELYLTYCSDEVKRLLGHVEQQCAQTDVCTTDQANLFIEVLKADPSRQGKFLSLMQDRRHIAYYLPEEGRTLTPIERKQLRDLVEPAWLDDSSHRTRFLVASHPADPSSESIKRATRRGNLIIDEIRTISSKLNRSLELPLNKEGGEPAKAGSPPSPRGDVPTEEPPPAPLKIETPLERRVLHWVFEFMVNGEQLRPEDRPRRSLDLRRSVWVFRVDC
jgi:hypothetical protein